MHFTSQKTKSASWDGLQKAAARELLWNGEASKLERKVVTPDTKKCGSRHIWGTEVTDVWGVQVCVSVRSVYSYTPQFSWVQFFAFT